jgi:hypothetical protein
MKYQNCAAVAQAPDEPLELDVGLRLSDANINPSTGLATDYLNRFNEAVTLLDMLATCPEFRNDFLSWEPMSFASTFAPRIPGHASSPLPPTRRPTQTCAAASTRWP